MENKIPHRRPGDGEKGVANQYEVGVDDDGANVELVLEKRGLIAI